MGPLVRKKKRNFSVSVETWLDAGRQRNMGWISSRRTDYPLFLRSTLALECNQPHVQKVLRILSSSVADYRPSSSVNLLKPKTYFMYHQSEHSAILCSAHNIFMCCAWISEQTTFFSLYTINITMFITVAESVYCAVWTGSLKQTDRVSFLMGLRLRIFGVKIRFPHCSITWRLINPNFTEQLVCNIILYPSNLIISWHDKYIEQ